MPRAILRFSAIVIALSLTPIATAATVLLNPSKDNTLIQTTNPAAQLSNGQGDIFIGRTNQDGQNPATISVRRGLIAFDIAAAVPNGAVITNVSLTLLERTGLNGDRNAELHRVLEDWGEGGSFQDGGAGAAAQDGDATWLYRFFNAAAPAASAQWTTAGGSFDPLVSAALVISDDLGGGQSFTWSSPQMVADVQGWVNNPATNFGWLLQGVESVALTAKRFDSGDAGGPITTPNVQPVLRIDYVPEPSAAALATLGATALGLAGWRRAARQAARHSARR